MRKLNIGCGPSILEGWLNTDIQPIDTRVMRLDATQQFPFSDDEFDRIFSEHMIEHVPYAGGATMLAECYRTLKPSGRIRISTPSIEFLYDLMWNPTPQTERYVDWACRAFSPHAPRRAETVINNFVRAWGHQFIWSGGLMMTELARAGFREMRHCRIGQSSDPEFVGLENVGRMPEGFLQLETMTVEAEKPSA